MANAATLASPVQSATVACARSLVPRGKPSVATCVSTPPTIGPTVVSVPSHATREKSARTVSVWSLAQQGRPTAVVLARTLSPIPTTVDSVAIDVREAKFVHQVNVLAQAVSKIATEPAKTSRAIEPTVVLVVKLVVPANFVPTASVWCRVLAAKPTATANVPTPTQTTNIVELVGQFAWAARPVNLEYANAKAPVRIAAVSATT